MKKNKNNIIKILLENKKVNNYTKLLIILNTLDFYEDYYIPNKKLMNMLGLTKYWVIQLLKQLKEDNIISIFYKGRKRYFTFIANKSKDEKEEIKPFVNIFDYNWLEDEE